MWKFLRASRHLFSWMSSSSGRTRGFILGTFLSLSPTNTSTSQSVIKNPVNHLWPQKEGRNWLARRRICRDLISWGNTLWCKALKTRMIKRKLGEVAYVVRPARVVRLPGTTRWLIRLLRRTSSWGTADEDWRRRVRMGFYVVCGCLFSITEYRVKKCGLMWVEWYWRLDVYNFFLVGVGLFVMRC